MGLHGEEDGMALTGAPARDHDYHSRRRRDGRTLRALSRATLVLSARASNAGNEPRCGTWAGHRTRKALEETAVQSADGKQFVITGQAKGCCGKIFQACSVGLPPTLRLMHNQGA
jgi:hypothetical protein